VPKADEPKPLGWMKPVKKCLLYIVMMWIPMWPFLDVSCPLIWFFPSAVQTFFVDFHVQEVPPESKLTSDDIESFSPVIEMHGITTEQDVMQTIYEHPYSSVLFKGYMSTADAANILERFKTLTLGNQYTLVNASKLE
jgi:hypothetical protein